MAAECKKSAISAIAGDNRLFRIHRFFKHTTFWSFIFEILFFIIRQAVHHAVFCCCGLLSAFLHSILFRHYSPAGRASMSIPHNPSAPATRTLMCALRQSFSESNPCPDMCSPVGFVRRHLLPHCISPLFTNNSDSADRTFRHFFYIRQKSSLSPHLGIQRSCGQGVPSA